MADVEDWQLRSETQKHNNKEGADQNIRSNGATDEEARFIIYGEKRVELNEFSSPDLVAFVESKLKHHGVEKVIPDSETLVAAWRRAHTAIRVNRLIESTWDDSSADVDLAAEIPPMPPDLADRIRASFAEDDTQPWDKALWDIAADDA
jgi:hypothetical protein